MRLVCLESPYAGLVEINLSYARDAMHDCLLRGEAPIASHLLYTQPGILNDSDPGEREMGIRAGFAWNAHAAATIVYTDLGISRGMRYGIEDAARAGRPVEYRSLPGWASFVAAHRKEIPSDSATNALLIPEIDAREKAP